MIRIIASAGRYNTNLGSVTFEYKDGSTQMSHYELIPLDESISDIMRPAKLYFSGLNYTYNPHRMFLNRACNIHHEDFGKGELSEFQEDKLYHCVADLYSAKMLGTVESLYHGLLAIIPRDREENPFRITNRISFKMRKVQNSKNGMHSQHICSLLKMADYLENMQSQESVK